MVRSSKQFIMGLPGVYTRMKVLTYHYADTQSFPGGGYDIVFSAGADGLVKHWT